MRTTSAFLRATMTHSKCVDTTKPYLRSSVYRSTVPTNRIPWIVPFSEYKPVDYTDPNIKGRDWADVDIKDGTFKWNSVDGGVDRISFEGAYSIDENGRPQNPIGRTGMCGRGVLGRWGPNHAADPLVTRFKDGKLQFVAIQRHDTGEWAIPGGMVDAGETTSATLKREFTEETLDGVESATLKDLWNHGVEIYKGYVDDPRNTDNSWMETVCVNFHDSKGVLDSIKFKAGDDAANVRFVTVDADLNLYASHGHFIRLLAQRHGFVE